MDRAIKDASDYDLQVTDVKVNGTTATAKVRQGDDGKVATFTFVKDKGGWRASALGAAQLAPELRVARLGGGPSAGRHHHSLSRYQSIVACRPARKSPYLGSQPSWVRIFVESFE